MSIFDSIEQAVRDRQPDYPPSKSAGGTNTFTVKHCKAVGFTPGYCVCLNKIAAFERDKGLASYAECEKAISTKSCVAMGMRDEEQIAGRALYYVDRALVREEMDKAFAAAAPKFKTSTPPKVSKPQPQPSSVSVAARVPAAKPETTSLIPDTPDNDYAAAINAAIQQETAKPAVTVEPEKVPDPSPSPVKKGLSMLEIVRMQMGKQSENRE